MEGLEASVDRVARESRFSGIVRVDADGEIQLAKAYGLAHRGLEVANTVDTQFAIASGNKGLTALAVVRLIEQGVLELSTPARSVLGDDLPLIADDVTVEHLLAHRSGIGDYLDEDGDDEVTDYLMPVSVHELANTEDFVRVLDGHQTKFAAGERFSYCNGGFMVLALIAERASGTPFHDLIEREVSGPAGMADTAFLRSDELPGHAAIGYLGSDSDRTNVFHLPVRGNGDGGIYTTVADVHAFWAALFAGRIVERDWVARMIEPISHAPEDERRYGLGFWLHATGPAVMLVGYDAGVSFQTVHDPARALTSTVISNWTDGAWPMGRHLGEVMDGA